MAHEALSPRVGATLFVDTERCVVACLDLCLFSEVRVVGVELNLAREPPRLFVSEAQLAVYVESPGVKVAVLGDGSGVPEASSDGRDLVLFFSLLVHNRDFLGHLDFSLLTETKLSHFGLAPPVEVSVLSDSEREEGTALDLSHGFSVEALDILRGGANLDGFGEAQLSLEPSSPRVYVSLVGENEGMTLSTSDFDDPLVLKRL